MAGVLVHPRAALHRQRHGEGARERGRIVDRVLVEQRVVVDAREALRQPQGGAGPHRADDGRVEAGRLIGEVGRLDDERITLPVAAGVAHPLPDAVGQVRAAVERHDARVVHHLVQDRDVVGGLEDLQVLVVARRHDRRSGVEAQEAALGQPAVLGAVGADAADAEAHGARRRDVLRVGRSALLRHPRLQRGHAPVGGIDDQRRAAVVDHARAAVEPEVVVGADVAAGGQRLGADLARRIGLGGALHGRRLDLGCLLRREHRLRLVGRPLEGSQRPEVPHALQIRLAVRRARQLVVGGLLRGHVGRRHEHGERERDQPPRRDGSISHLKPPRSTPRGRVQESGCRRGDHDLGRPDRSSIPRAPSTAGVRARAAGAGARGTSLRHRPR